MDYNLSLIHIYSLAISIVTVVVALIGPVCGVLADRKDKKKIFFTTTAGLGITGCEMCIRDRPMVGFATGKQSHTGKRVRETGKVIVTDPGKSLAGAVMACGASTGAETDQVAANNIETVSYTHLDVYKRQFRIRQWAEQ